MRIEILVDVKTELGEGPLWDVQMQRLFWIDSTGRRIFRATANGGELRCWETPSPIGSMALPRDRGDIVALQTGLHALDFADGAFDPIVDPEPELAGNRLNDGKVDRQGRFVFGSMDTLERTPSGGFYRLDTDLTCHRLDGGVICANGPCWSPDGSILYFGDSWAGEIYAYPYDADTGAVGARRVFARADPALGGAFDGSTVDAEGGLWNARVLAGKLLRYAPDGSVDRVVEMPVAKVTSVMFGGPDLDTLFVTSMGRRHQPHFPPDGQMRGAVFAVTDLGVRGLPEMRFQG